MSSAILLQVIANSHAIRERDVLVEDRSPNPALSSDDTIIENDRVFD
jgi:hypothetical protein